MNLKVKLKIFFVCLKKLIKMDTTKIQNLPRPAAFLKVKQTILKCHTAGDIKMAAAMIDRYIYDVCEKPLREEHKKDLVHILNWQATQLGVQC